MHEEIEELKNDFSEMIDSINFKEYSPTSSNFQNALDIGLMWMLLKKMDKVQEKQFRDEYEEAQEELMGAEKYLEMYLEKKDPTLKEMASQECHHAKFFLDKIRLMSKDNEEKVKYNNLLSWYNNLISKINS